MNSGDTDKLLAHAQIGLAFLIAIGFLAMLGILLFHSTTLTTEGTTIVTGLLSVLGTILTLQMNFFFARHRPAAQTLPDDPDNGNGHATEKLADPKDQSQPTK